MIIIYMKIFYSSYLEMFPEIHQRRGNARHEKKDLVGPRLTEAARSNNVIG